MNHTEKGLFAYANNQQGFVIDTQKGVYIDSSMMNVDQYNKYYRTWTRIRRPHLKGNQVMNNYQMYLLGERLLRLKNIQNTRNMGRLGFLASKTYVIDNCYNIFGKSLAQSQLSYCTITTGINRTDVEREKIVDYAQKRLNNASNLALIPFHNEQLPKQQVIQTAADILRSRYLSKNSPSPTQQ